MRQASIAKGSYGDARFKDWGVSTVRVADVHYGGQTSPGSTAVAVGLRWAYSHANGHYFSNCDSSSVDIRIDVLCPPT